MIELSELLIKVSVLGDNNVGKENFVKLFASKVSNENLKLNIGVEFYEKILSIDTDLGYRDCRINIWNFTGEERFKDLYNHYLRGTKGILLFFDLANRKSFEHLYDWIDKINSSVKSKIPILVVANKSDLEYYAASPKEIDDLITTFNLFYIETSAISKEGIFDSFYCIVSLALGIEVNNEYFLSKDIIYRPNQNPVYYSSPSPLTARDLSNLSQIVIFQEKIEMLERKLNQMETKRSETIIPKEHEPQKKYKLIYKDLCEDKVVIEKVRFRVGIAQIGVSKTGNILEEFYETDSLGLLGLQENKVETTRSNVKTMIKKAYNEKVNILLFPEMVIDLNYSTLQEEIAELAKSYKMYIIPGSYHNKQTSQNVSVVFGPEGILWEQEKHIPAIIHLKGKRFKEGIHDGILPRKTIVCNTEFGRIVIVICRDFLDMDLRVELKNFEPPVDLILNPAFTPVTDDFKAVHFDARRSIYAYCFFVNVAEFGGSYISTPEKDRTERIIPAKEERIIYKDVDLWKLRSERKKWENERNREKSFIQSTR